MEKNILASFLISLSVCPPFLIALARIKNFDRQYTPFVFYLFLGVVTEIASFIFIHVLNMSNAVPVNLYLLGEWCLIMWQFRCWGLFAKSEKMFFILTAIGFAAWFFEDIIAGKLFFFGPYSRWLYSFVIVMLSINAINFTITNDFKNLFRNARFIICLCFIIFFSYKIIYEWAYQVLDINKNIKFSNKIISFFGYLNATVNLTYCVVMLVIPPRQKIDLAGSSLQPIKSRLLQ